MTPCIASYLILGAFALAANGEGQTGRGKELKSDPAESVQLYVRGKLIKPLATYSCSSLTRELHCSSDKADDTAHLSENPDAEFLRPEAQFRVQKPARLSGTSVGFYLADEATLLDSPRYIKLTIKNGVLYLPAVKKRSTIIAIFKEPTDGLIYKSVWLVAPVS